MRTKCGAERAILTRFALVATLSVASAGATAWSMRKTIADSRLVSHSHEVLTGIERTLSMLERAKASQRGYLLTGEPGHLEAFRHAVEAVDDQIDCVAALTVDNPRQQDYLRHLDRLVAARLAAMRETMELHEKASAAMAVAVVPIDGDRSLVDPIWSVIASMQAEESGLLVRRAVAAENATGVLIVLSIVAATTSLLLVGFAYRLIAHELRRRQALEHRLEELAMTDSLTGLPNRRAVDEAIESAASRSRRHGAALSVVLMDVDHFKQLNDTCGHQVGDKVLHAVGQALRLAVRAEDVVGRYGGEEFLAVLADTDEAGSREAAERIRMAVRVLNLALPAVTISLGVSTSSAQATDGADLVAEADRALYASKRGGRNRVTHFHELELTAGGGAPAAESGGLSVLMFGPAE